MKRYWIIILLLSANYLSAQYDAGKNGQKLDWALYYLQNHYVDSTDNDYLTEVALRAIVEELDPFSRYQSAEEAEKQLNRDKGIKEYGIGLRFYILNDTAIITSITDGSSAEIAGVEKGDQIIGIDGGSIIDYNWNNINALLKGKKDTEVTLKLLRHRKEEIELEVLRAAVPYHSIIASHLLSDKTAYIKLQTFNSRTIPEFEDFSSKHDIENFVIDLRNNRGGVLNAAIKLADHFLAKDQLIAYSKGYNLERKDYLASGDGKYQNAKLVLLVDENTMSASETFTAAMQDWDRCLIIGTNTYGKGLIQQSYKLGDGSTLRITIGKYFSPNGREIQKQYDVDTNWLNKNEMLIPASGLTSELNIPKEYIYKSKGGRNIISGHGGIAPDIYLNTKSQKDEYYEMLNDEGLVFGFVTWYVHENRKRLLKLFPSVDLLIENPGLDAEIDYTFTKYLERKNKEWDLGLVLKPIPTTPRTMKQIKSWIGTQLYGTKAYYQAYHEDDILIQTALESLNNNTFSILELK